MSRSSSRNPFSAEDDSYLVRYIAKYNPSASNRSGNALYQRLCENADRKWPWSSRHPWQSWRDRYYKNSDAFNSRIAKYIKKYNLSEEPEQQDPALFSSKRVRSSKVDTHFDDEENSDDPRPPKRKRVLSSGGDGQIKTKESVDDTKIAPQTLSRGRQDGRFKQSEVPVKIEARVVVKKEEEESEAGEGDAEIEEINTRNEGDKGGSEVTKEEEKVEYEDENGDNNEDEDMSQKSGSVSTSVPPIKTEDISSTETESDQGEDDSESQEDQLDTTQSALVKDTPNRQQDNVPPLYPDISTLPSPHPREREQTQPPSNRHAFVKPIMSRHRPRSSPQPVASSSKVQLSPSHRLSRNSSLLQGTEPKRQNNLKDDDFFASVPPTPTSPTPPPPVKRKPPQLVEGRFRNAFVDAPGDLAPEDSSSDGAEKQKVWPPKRKRKTSSQIPIKEQSGSKVGVQVGEMASNAKKAIVESRQKSRESTQQVALKDTETSSQRVLLPSRPSTSKHHPFTQPEEKKGSLMNQVSLNGTADHAVSKEHTPTNQVRGTRGTPSTTTPRENPRASSSTFLLTRNSKSNQGFRHQMADAPIQALRPSSRAFTFSGPSQRRSSSLRNETKFVEHAPPTDSFTPGNPFKVHPESMSESKGKARAKAPSLFIRRHSIDYTSERKVPIAHIDLRSQSLNHTRQSLPPRTTHIPTATSTADTSAQPSLLPIPIAAEDQFKVEYLGMAAAVTMISKRFSVSEEVVWRGWERTKSISKTEEYCRRLAELNARSEATVLKEMQKSGLISQDEETPARTPRSTNGSPRSRRSSALRKLMIKPFVDDDVISEYTPPSSTRAAQYARLMRQGRNDEALAREWQRATFGGGSFPLKQDDPERSSPVRKTDVVGQAEEDILSRGGTLPPTTPSVAGSGENVEDVRYTGTEDLDEEAFLTATAESAETLREIERRVDPDMMLQWAANLLVQVRNSVSQPPQNTD